MTAETSGGPPPGADTVRILVPFAGQGSGVDELTWGQKGIWQTITLAGASRTMGGVVPLRPGATVEGVAASFRCVMGRHQSLRTRLRFAADGHPQQVLSSAGELAMEIVEAGEADPAEVADSVRRRYRATNFDYVNEWPVRVAVVRRHGVPTHVVAIYLHLALDAHGLAALMADLSTLDRATGEETAPLTGLQPMELARRQRTPAMQRQCDASLRHLERVMRAVPPQRFGEPDGPPEPSYRMAALLSPAALLAVRAAAGRAAVDTSPVLLAAFAVVLARITGINPVLSCFFNDRRLQGRPAPSGPVPTEPEVRDVLPRSEHRWLDEADLPLQKLYLDVNDAPGAVDLILSADTRYLPPARMEEILHGIEAVLVEAVRDPAMATGVGPVGVSV